MVTDLISTVIEVLLALLMYLMSSGFSLIATKALIHNAWPFSVVFHRSIYIPILTLTLLLIRKKNAGWHLSDLGVKTEGFRVNLREGLISFSASYMVYLPFLAFLMPQYATKISAFGGGLGEISLQGLVFMVLAYSPVVLIESPIPEEIFFRGYYQGTLTEEFKHFVGIPASTLFFALSHAINHPNWHPGRVLATIPIGLILGLTYHETRSLISVITSHFLINFLPMYPILFYSKGQIFLAVLTLIVLAIISFTILTLYIKRTEGLIQEFLEVIKLLDFRSLLLIILFTVFPLLFSYIAVQFKP